MANIPELSPQEWSDVVAILTCHAHRSLQRRYWRGAKLSRGGAVPGGVEPQDLASEAIVDFLGGKRVWNTAEQPDLLQFLRGVVDSKISHLVNSAENRTTGRMDSASLGAEKPSDAYAVMDRAASPATVVERKDMVAQARTLLKKEIGSDKEAVRVMECLEADIMRPADMAVVLETPVEEVYKIQQKLKLKYEKVRKMLEKGSKS